MLALGRHDDDAVGQERALLAVHLDRHEVLVDHDLLVFERLALHDVAPVAGGVADREQDRLVLTLRELERLVSPRVPLDRTLARRATPGRPRSTFPRDLVSVGPGVVRTGYDGRMFHRVLFASSLALTCGCALDGTGARPGAGGADAASTAAGPGGTSGSTTTGATSSTSTGDPSGPGSGGAPGTGGSGAGGPGTGGEGATTSTGGGAEGGAGGASGGGTGETASNGETASTGGTGGTGGFGGAGGAAPVCGNGTLESGEECETPNGSECALVSCEWLGDCGDDIVAPFVPGGTLLAGNTTQAPTVADFGTPACGDNGAAPVQLYKYTTGSVPSYVEVVAFPDVAGLSDAILSLHTSCSNDSALTCFIGAGLGPCCADGPTADANEVLQTIELPPGTTVEAAVTGYQDISGAYDVRFREYRYLIFESFDAGPGTFTIGSGWLAANDCVGGTDCLGVPGNGNYPNEILSSPSFSTVGVAAVFLQWHHWVDNADANPSDEQRVEISTNGGTSWTRIYSQGDGVDENDTDEQVDISAYAGSADAQVRFVYADGNGSDFGWYVDDVRVLAW